MAKQCPHCEMESDRDEYCTFCGKLIETTEPGPPGKSQAPPSGKRPASPVPPGAAPRGPSAEAGPAKTGAPAKRAPAKIERGRPAWVYYVAVVVGLIVLYVFACFALAFTASSPPDEAADWKRIETKTKQMSIEAPGNWDCTLSGSEGSFEFVTVRAGKTYTVTMRGTQAKGSIGDIGAATAQAMSGSSEGGLDLPTSQTAEGGLHQFIAMTESHEDPYFADTSDIQEGTFGGKAAACSDYSTVRKFGGGSPQ